MDVALARRKFQKRVQIFQARIHVTQACLFAEEAGAHTTAEPALRATGESPDARSTRGLGSEWAGAEVLMAPTEIPSRGTLPSMILARSSMVSGKALEAGRPSVT